MARLSSQVATRRAHFEHLLVADLHGAGRCATAFADVPGARARDRDDSRSTSWALGGGDRCSALGDLAIRICAGEALEEDVAARHDTPMAPPIVWRGHLAAQRISVGIRPTDQGWPPTRQCGRERADLLGVER